MPLHYIKNPMYALCLLAAVCVRQHVQNNRFRRMYRTDQALTKGVSFQTPTTVHRKLKETNLKTVTNPSKELNYVEVNRKKPVNLEEADSLVHCVQNFAERARRIVNDIRTSIPGSKSTESIDPLTSSNILDSLLYLTSDVGIKWLA
ncbi:uncharacterized protein LOC117234600 isoform X1 [Bombus vosnesenskii]|uniref:Uncharacterized protein LOC117234600 isoform X1 n=1 Tax=Bombus vosnesenskii TaxID=207650 RepID=A0A6J3KFB0_9HYME|nr:uncharacterized protein LOC117234600 isoform X1 [Bombus vosnesenskii]